MDCFLKNIFPVGAEELSSCKEQAVMQFRAHKLDKKDFFGKSDPFLTFSRSNEDGRYDFDTLCMVSDNLFTTLIIEP